MSVQILIGDCREKLRELPDASVHCCVTSPPYFGLRDYGTVVWEGGDPNHEHDRIPARNGRGGSGSPGKNTKNAFPSHLPAELCSCGAVRIDRQMGLEPTPDEFVAGMVEVFREVRRVLRDDGTLWLNIGDSYSGSGKGGNPEAGKQATNKGSQSVGVLYGKTGDTARQAAVTNVTRDVEGIPPKNLIGIPWMLAFALRADGWFLRQDIIWSKPNPMPESVRDRCTKAHEYIFMFSKKPKYFYDIEAIKEPAARTDVGSWTDKSEKQRGHGRRHEGFNGRYAERIRAEGAPQTRNKRSVWNVAPRPFKEAHFATYPPALIEPCILAGCPAGGTVLDPFFGAGTTGLVAKQQGRKCIGIELNEEYAAIAERRIANDKICQQMDAIAELLS